jgi:hypothetical protein
MGWEVFDADDKSLGIYSTQKQAASVLMVLP